MKDDIARPKFRKIKSVNVSTIFIREIINILYNYKVDVFRQKIG